MRNVLEFVIFHALLSRNFCLLNRSLCRSACVQNWPIATNLSLGPDVSFRGEAEVGRAAEPAASVVNDPFRQTAPLNWCATNDR